MIIRDAVFDDADDLLQWRNDPVTCAMSITCAPVKAEDHYKWFKSSLQNANRIIYIAEDDGQKIGMCRFDYDVDGHKTEISINLNPSMRGKGYGAAMLAQSIEQYPKSCPLLATVKRANVVSIKAFEKVGFLQSGEDSEYLYFTKDL